MVEGEEGLAALPQHLGERCCERIEDFHILNHSVCLLVSNLIAITSAYLTGTFSYHFYDSV